MASIERFFMIDFMAVFSSSAVKGQNITGHGRLQEFDADGDTVTTKRYDRPAGGPGDGMAAFETLLLVPRPPANRKALRELVQGSTNPGELHAGTVVWIHRSDASHLTSDDPPWPTCQRIAGDEAAQVLGIKVGAIWIESRVPNAAAGCDFNEFFVALCNGSPIRRDALEVLRNPHDNVSTESNEVARLRAVVSHARHEMFRAVGPIDWNIAIGGNRAMERAAQARASAYREVCGIGKGLSEARGLLSDPGKNVRLNECLILLSAACLKVELLLNEGQFCSELSFREAFPEAFREAYRGFRKALQDVTKELDACQGKQP